MKIFKDKKQIHPLPHAQSFPLPLSTTTLNGEEEEEDKKIEDEQKKNDEQEINDSKWIIERIEEYFIHKICRFKKEPYEKTSRKIVLLFIIGITGLMLILGSIFTPWLVLQIVQIILTIFFVLIFIILLFLKNVPNVYETILFIFCFVFNILFLCLAIGQEFNNFNGFLFNPMYHGFIIIPVLSILLNGYSMLWIMMYFVLYCSLLVYDVVTMRPVNVELINDNNTRLGIILQLYVINGISTFSILFTSMYYKYNIKKERNLVGRISQSIADLSLETSFIKKIMTNRSYSETVDHLKKVIENMKSYKTFLPTVDTNDEDYCYDDEDDEELSSDKYSENEDTIISNVSEEKIKEQELIMRKDVYMEERNVTLLHLLIKKEGKSLIALKQSYQNVIDVVILNCRIWNGFLVNCFGNNFFIAWNCRKRSINSLSKAAKFALSIKEELSSKNMNNNTYISFGNMILSCGNVGNDNFRRFNLLDYDDEIYEAIKVTRMNFKYNTNIIVAQKAYKELKYKYDFKQISYDGSLKKGFYALINKKRIISDEWMYEIKSELRDSTSSENEDGRLRCAWELFVDEKHDESYEIVSKLNQNDKFVANLLDQLTKEKCKKSESKKLYKK